MSALCRGDFLALTAGSTAQTLTFLHKEPNAAHLLIFLPAADDHGGGVSVFIDFFFQCEVVLLGQISLMCSAGVLCPTLLLLLKSQKFLLLFFPSRSMGPLGVPRLLSDEALLMPWL